MWDMEDWLNDINKAKTARLIETIWKIVPLNWKPVVPWEVLSPEEVATFFI